MKKLCLVLLSLALSGCIDNYVEPLVFGAIAWPGYDPAYIARDLEYLKPDQVHLAEFTNSTEVLRAFRNRQLHVAGLTLDEALELRKSVHDLRVFLVADVSHGADVLMVRQGIKSLSQLRGKHIGVEKTALGAYFLSLILRAAHLSPKEVHVVSLPLDEHVAAYRSGLVDAVVSFGRVRNELSGMGAVELFDSSRVPGKIVDILAVRAEDIEKHNRHLYALVEAWFRALQVIQSDPERAYPLMARHERVTKEDIGETLRGLELLDKQQNLQQISGVPPVLFKTSTEIQSILRESGLPVGGDDLSQFIISRFVTEPSLD